MKDTIRELWREHDAGPENFADNHGEATTPDESITYGGYSARPLEESSENRLLDCIVREAIEKGASDIHIEPYEESSRVRLRIDGVLYELTTTPPNTGEVLVGRIKDLAGLDSGSNRGPKKGVIKLKIGQQRRIDLRVSIMPTLYGEKVAVRVLDRSRIELDMTRLGFDPHPLELFTEAIHKRFGMVLVTGPLGSGKTTTLYSMLANLDSADANVYTVEDPVKFHVQGCNQVELREDMGLTFADAVRFFVQEQDADIIMISEVRDLETARAAATAAINGRLVLARLHAFDTAEAVGRLLNMGLEPYLVAGSLNLIVAQRLVRRICENCKEEIEPPQGALTDIGVKMKEIGTFTVFEGTGCHLCTNTGFKGRIALYETMPVTEEIRELVMTGAHPRAIKREAMRLGMETLRMAGRNKLREGLTTIGEVARATMPD
jgi:type IV pilus assembly protein PilB